ncbi:MAG: hypothetical protein AAF705_06610 [Bacteroidota bacterium]
MQRTFNYYFLGLFALIALSCQGIKKEADNLKKEPNHEVTTKPLAMVAKFTCKDLTVDEAMPRFEVALDLNDTLHVIDTIMSCSVFSEDEYAQYQIPKEAVSACGGWWAGAGDYFYATFEANVCTVMQGWQDEQQEDEGFHYEQVRRMVVSAE